jgi:hypothetical protein
MRGTFRVCCALAVTGADRTPANDVSRRGYEWGLGHVACQCGTVHRHPASRVSAAAFSNQYVMPISRYIVVAVVRCSWACSRLSVRR